MKIVLDTNVVISGLVFPGGAPDRIVRAVLTGRFNHATSPDLLTELRRVLAKKFSLSSTKIEELVKLVTSVGEIVYPTERLNIVKGDETDNRVLECAVTAQADFIITGDERHLLCLKKWKRIRIISPANFVEEMAIL